MKTRRKFACIPTVVWTWRKAQTRALIWLQWYSVYGADKFVPLNGTPQIGEKYCDKLGLFSIEFQ